MAGGRRILITGVGNHWGTELARRLERRADVEQVIGIDVTRPDADLEQTELLEADIRSPVLARVIPSTRADTVVHTGHGDSTVIGQEAPALPEWRRRGH